MPYFMKPNSAGAAKPKAKKAKKHPENKENYNPRVKKTSIGRNTSVNIISIIIKILLFSILFIHTFPFLATRKNPRRSVPAINYTEAEVPRVDQYVCKYLKSELMITLK